MNKKPQCIIITGRPGSGKTTLAGELCKKMYLPKISRDEIKEGYVNTFGVKHDRLPKDTNGKVNHIFFEAILTLLKGHVSIIVEAAFQHKLWDRVVLRIHDIALLSIIICEVGAELRAHKRISYRNSLAHDQNNVPALLWATDARYAGATGGSCTR